MFITSRLLCGSDTVYLIDRVTISVDTSQVASIGTKEPSGSEKCPELSVVLDFDEKYLIHNSSSILNTILMLELGSLEVADPKEERLKSIRKRHEGRRKQLETLIDHNRSVSKVTFAQNTPEKVS